MMLCLIQSNVEEQIVIQKTLKNWIIIYVINYYMNNIKTINNIKILQEIEHLLYYIKTDKHRGDIAYQYE